MFLRIHVFQHLGPDLTLFRMGFFRAALIWGGGGGGGGGWGRVRERTSPSLKYVTHILQWSMMKLGTVIHYLRKIQIIYIYISCDTPCWHQHFFTRNSKFCYIKCTYSLYFDKHSYNFDDARKNSYPQAFLK